CVPLLKLPVTGDMVKGVYLEKCDFVNDDSSMNMNLNDFKDKEDVAFSEAVMEIFKKNRIVVYLSVWLKIGIAGSNRVSTVNTFASSKTMLLASTERSFVVEGGYAVVF
ncbi:hypothetical protein Tco_0757135, partial [Tanacetum coccineum]